MDPENTQAEGTQQEAPQGGAARAQDQGRDPRDTRLERATAFLEKRRAQGGTKPEAQQPEDGDPSEDEGTDPETPDEAEAEEQGEQDEKPEEQGGKKKHKPSQYERTKAQRDRIRQQYDSLETDYRKVYGIARQLKDRVTDLQAENAHLRSLMQQNGVDEDPNSRALREAQQRQRDAERRAQQLEQERQNAEHKRNREQIESLADQIVEQASHFSTKYRVDAAEIAEEYDLAVRTWERRGRQGPEPKVEDVAKMLARHANASAVQRRQDPTTRAPLITPKGGRGASARVASKIPLKTKDGGSNSAAIANDLLRRRGVRAG